MTQGGFRDIRVVRRAAAPDQRARSTHGRIIYAVSSVDGRHDLLGALLEAIVADVALLPDDARPLLIFCGDYLGRDGGGADVMAMLVWLSRQDAIETVFLRGASDAALLDFLAGPDDHPAWPRSDGAATMRAYGIGPADDDHWRSHDAVMDAMPASHLDLLRAMPIRTTCGDHVFADGRVLASGVPVPWTHEVGDAIIAIRLDGTTVAYIEARCDAALPIAAEPRERGKEDAPLSSMRGALSMLRPEY